MVLMRVAILPVIIAEPRPGMVSNIPGVAAIPVSARTIVVTPEKEIAAVVTAITRGPLAVPVRHSSGGLPISTMVSRF